MPIVIAIGHTKLTLLVKSVHVRDFPTWPANFVLCEVHAEVEEAAFF
jgi:hypothetical protein